MFHKFNAYDEPGAFQRRRRKFLDYEGCITILKRLEALENVWKCQYFAPPWGICTTKLGVHDLADRGIWGFI